MQSGAIILNIYKCITYYLVQYRCMYSIIDLVQSSSNYRNSSRGHAPRETRRWDREYMYIYIYIYIYTCIYIYIYRYTHVYTGTYTHALYIYARHTYLLIYAYMYLHIRISDGETERRAASFRQCWRKTKVVLVKVVSWQIYDFHMRIHICVMKLMACVYINNTLFWKIIDYSGNHLY